MLRKRNDDAEGSRAESRVQEGRQERSLSCVARGQRKGTVDRAFALLVQQMFPRETLLTYPARRRGE